jgi:hypothetical protein
LTAGKSAFNPLYHFGESNRFSPFLIVFSVGRRARRKP